MNQFLSAIKKWHGRVFTNIRHKFRLVIMDENFHEKLSFRLSRLNVLMGVSLTAIGLVVITTFLIVFTSLREYIPGYMNEDVNRLAYENKYRTDSLAKQMEGQEMMLEILSIALNGNIPPADAIHLKDSLKDYRNIDYQISKADSLFRSDFEASDKYNLGTVFLDAGKQVNLSSAKNHLFYSPLQGRIIGSFKPSENRYGIRISGKYNDAAKAVLSGTVLYTDWSPENLYSVIIQHDDGIISVYKMNSSLLKKTGDIVKAGEAISFVETLYFELWQNGSPLNPDDYILF